MSVPASSMIRWRDLPGDSREILSGKLVGLWGATSDESAFDGLTEDKQQALWLISSRMIAHELWPLVKSIDNIYGEGGVGISFTAWPAIRSTLSRRKDFTWLFANHRDTSGGFYEKGRPDAVLHFLYQHGQPPRWYVHFDLYSPVYSVRSALRHFRHEFIGNVRPDWKMIQRCLKE